MQDEPQRTQLATAVVRASVEVERTMVELRFLVRRDYYCALVALSQELASYASRLGEEADTIADEDPLVPPARVVQRLREIPGPATELGPTLQKGLVAVRFSIIDVLSEWPVARCTKRNIGYDEHINVSCSTRNKWKNLRRPWTN
jgi:hypothetical protein